MADKISRKDLKEPDEFISLTQKGMQWMQKNQSLLIGAVAVLAVAILAAFGFRWYVVNGEKKASFAFEKARDIMEAKVVPGDDAGTSRTDGTFASEEDRSQAALDALEKFLDQYGSSRTAQLAQFTIGKLYQRMGKYDKASEAFQNYLKEAGLHGELAAFALENLGTSLEDKGETDKAREQFKRLTEPPFQNNKDRGLYHLARLEQHAGNLAKAREQFETIAQDFPKSPFLRDIQTRLALLPESGNPDQAKKGTDSKPRTSAEPADKPAPPAEDKKPDA